MAPVRCKVTSNSQPGVTTVSSYTVIFPRGLGKLPPTVAHIPYVAGWTPTLEFSGVPWGVRWFCYFHNPQFPLLFSFYRFAFATRTQQSTAVTSQSLCFLCCDSTVLCGIGSSTANGSIGAVCFSLCTAGQWSSAFLML